MPHRRRGSALLAGAAAICLVLGCGGGSEPPEEVTSEDLVLEIKYNALKFVDAAQANAAGVEGYLETLVETLEAYDPSELGEHADTCAELLDTAKTLEGAALAQNQEQLSEIASLAEQLPGDVSELEEEAEEEPVPVDY